MEPSTPKKKNMKRATLLPPSPRDRSLISLEMPPPESTTSHKVKKSKMVDVTLYLGDWNTKVDAWPCALAKDTPPGTKMDDLVTKARNTIDSVSGGLVPAGLVFVGRSGRETVENMIDRQHLQKWIGKTISSYEEYERGLLIVHVTGKMDGGTNSIILPRSRCVSDILLLRSVLQV